jgi:hypothetical protein
VFHLGARLPLIALLSAELYLCLARSRELTILAKVPSQRTQGEQREVDRGLRRSVLLEALLLVPASVLLMLLLVVPFAMESAWIKQCSEGIRSSSYAAFGLVSFGFPFTAVRRAVTRVALRTLTEFASIAQSEARDSM